MASKRAVRSRLQRAENDCTAVRLARDIPGAGVIEGYVVGVGQKWVLLAHVPSTRMDGYVAVRVRDVARVQPHGSHDFYRALAEVTGTWPPSRPATVIDLDATRRLVDEARSNSAIVNLHVEYDDPEVSFVGVPIELNAEYVVLEEVTPEATWDGTVSRWRYGELSRIEFGSSYEADLLLVAGEAPGH